MLRFLFGILLILFAGSALAQTDSIFIRKIADEIFEHSTAYSNLHTLTKTVGGRLSGSPQTYAAEKWAQEALKNAGADHVYLQEAKIPHWVRGGQAQVALISGKKRISMAALALGNSVSTKPGGITAPMILIQNFAELERRKSEIQGKIVFFNYAFNKDFVTVFNAYADAVIYRVFGASRASKYGAVGVVIRSMTMATDNLPHTGAMIYNDSFPKIPELAVGLQDADKLASAYEKQKGTELYISTQAHTLPDTVGYNVIGEWKGSEFPDQYITVGGHLDSWDPAEGAQDDGAGCVHSVEVLRTLKVLGYKPKHTIRIVLFADEENGGHGGEAYAEAGKTNGETYSFAFESDAGGYTPRGMGFSMSAEQLVKVQTWLPLFIPYGVYQFTMGGGGSDIGPLHQVLKTP